MQRKLSVNRISREERASQDKGDDEVDGMIV